MAKQRIEIASAAVELPALPAAKVGLLDTSAAPSVTVAEVAVETKPGDVTAWDRAKAYYHTIIYAVFGLAVAIIGIAPAFEPALRLLSPKWQAGVALALLVAGNIVTRYKPNEVWKPAPTPEGGTDQS